MSQSSSPSGTKVSSWYAALQRSRLLQHRQILVLCGTRSWAMACAERLISACQCQHSVWLTDHKNVPASQRRLSLRQSRQLLGLDLDAAVIDGHESLRADALAIAGGALIGGGILLLLLPDSQVAAPPSPFVLRLWRFIERHSLSVWREEGVPLGSIVVTAAESAEWKREFTSLDDSGAANAQQAEVIDRLVQVATGHRRRPLVLQADRGRGKSAALGLATVRLLLAGKTRIGITAPRQDSIQTIFKHVQQALPDTRRQGLQLIWGAARVTFAAPDQWLQQWRDSGKSRVPLDVLWVDEAAAIPVPLLRQLLQVQARIAFATTVHGYEGSGQGFAIRFQQYLDCQTPQWKKCVLTDPIRWLPGDPLESWLADVLLLSAISDDQLGGDKPVETLTFSWLHGRAIDTSPWLEAAFALLVQAHYQTTPNDLQQLLDDPAVRICLATQADVVVGVLVVVVEGGLSAELASQVASGQRRPKGHLLPQVLAQQAGQSDWLAWVGARVQRIAVAPGWRRQGVGAALLAQLQDYASQHHWAWLGSSFAATADVMAFWQGSDYQFVHLGSRRDASSGCYSALVVKALVPEVEILQRHLRDRLQQRWYYLLPELWGDVEPDLVGLLSRDWRPCPPADGALPVLRAFIEGRRSYESALYDLAQWARWGLPVIATEAACELVIRKLLLRQTWPEVITELALTGHKQALQALREAMAEICYKAEADVSERR